jgi:hypothetical protein
MPVTSHKNLDYLLKEFRYRYENLSNKLIKRELRSNKEGTGGRSHWANPDNMCATVADKVEISLAIEDFKSILAELKKLK